MKKCPKCGFEIQNEHAEYCPNCQISFEGFELKAIKENVTKQLKEEKKKDNSTSRKIILYLIIGSLVLLFLLAPLLIFQIYRYRNVSKQQQQGLNVPESITPIAPSSPATTTTPATVDVDIDSFIETGKQLDNDVNREISQNKESIDSELLERVISWDIKLLNAIQNNPGVKDGDEALFLLYDINYKTYENWKTGYDHAKSALDMIDAFYNTPINKNEVLDKREALEKLSVQ